MEIAAVGYSDLRLFRRALIQFARCAREDGLVAGLCPGGTEYLSTFAAQWVSACLRYYQHTGDKEILSELFPAAERNIAAFERRLTPKGVTDDIGWGFVDWGYVRNPGAVDIAVNMHFLAAVRSMVKWCQTLGDAGKSDRYENLSDGLTATLSAWFDNAFAGYDAWNAIGFQRAVLGLRLGLLTGRREQEAVAAIKRHILSCFPLDPEAPRLSDPAAANPRLFTPYFAHFALPELVARGEMDFVLEALSEGVGMGARGWAHHVAGSLRSPVEPLPSMVRLPDVATLALRVGPGFPVRSRSPQLRPEPSARQSAADPGEHSAAGRAGSYSSALDPRSKRY